MLTVWDGSAGLEQQSGLVYRWKGYGERDSVHSLLRYVEAHGERLRQKYISFIHDLGEAQIDDKRLTEHLDIGGGFSLWWMSLLAEMSPFKSGRLLDCLRLLALEEILVDLRPAVVTLISADESLAEALKLLCGKLKIVCQWRCEGRKHHQFSLKQLYRALPHPARAVVYLVYYLFIRWPLRRVGTQKWYSGDRAVCFLSYLYHLDPKLAREGRFYPRQWEAFPKFLHDNGQRTNFVHMFLPSKDMPNARSAAERLKRFNRDSDRQGAHASLDSFLSLGIVFRVAFKWLRLTGVTLRMGSVRQHFQPNGTVVSLWPLLRSDWNTSVRGSTAIINLLWVELFNVAMRSLPRQELGLYLCENQGWERAFINAWRTGGHGELIAVPHSTVRFWHLSYVPDRRTLRFSGRCAQPLPDKVALNGKMAWSAFVQAGYAIDQLREVEALRYQYLAQYVADGSIRHVNAEPSKRPQPHHSKRVLILGDFTVDQTLRMLRCIEAAARLLARKLVLTLKPHPIGPVAQDDHPTLSFEITSQPLGEVMPDFDVAFSSNSTTAGLDAYLAGLPVVIFLDDEEANQSPLRGVEDVRFVSTPEELAAALSEDRRRRGSSATAEDFFWVDDKLPRWRRVLIEAGIKN